MRWGNDRNAWTCPGCVCACLFLCVCIYVSICVCVVYVSVWAQRVRQVEATDDLIHQLLTSTDEELLAYGSEGDSSDPDGPIPILAELQPGTVLRHNAHIYTEEHFAMEPLQANIHNLWDVAQTGQIWSPYRRGQQCLQYGMCRAIYRSVTLLTSLCSRRFCASVENAQVPLCDAVFEYLISPSGGSVCPSACLSMCESAWMCHCSSPPLLWFLWAGHAYSLEICSYDFAPDELKNILTFMSSRNRLRTEVRLILPRPLYWFCLLLLCVVGQLTSLILCDCGIDDT